MFDGPDVSVLLPVRNEEDHIDDVIGDLLTQEFDGTLEVVVADGHSDDATPRLLREWAERDSRLRVVANDEIHQSSGLNVAASVARSDTLIRADGHSRYAKDYVSRSLAALAETGGAVGGRMNPSSTRPVGRAVAAAMNNPLTMGPARFHHATSRERVDTVYLGCFMRQDFENVGGFRRFPSGSSEDADFYFRWRQSGRSVYVDPDIVTKYTPRETFGSLFRQYWRYGQGKAEMLWANGRLPSLRPLAPLALILGLLAALVLASIGVSAWPFWLLLGSWLFVLLAVAVPSGGNRMLVLVVAGLMHIAYGVGEVYGFVRGPGPVRRMVSQSPS